MSDLFLLATQNAWRFPSNKGSLTVEQLWQLPLSSKTGFDLDTVAKAVAAELRSLTEESFVSATTNPAKTELAAKLELLKAIIAHKMAANADVRRRAERAEQRRKLLDALAAKEEAELSSASREELLRKLAELDD